MKYILIDTFQNNEFYDIYVVDDRINDMVEIEQGLNFFDVVGKLNEFVKRYNITTADYVLYDEMEREINRITGDTADIFDIF